MSRDMSHCLEKWQRLELYHDTGAMPAIELSVPWLRVRALMVSELGRNETCEIIQCRGGEIVDVNGHGLTLYTIALLSTTHFRD